MKLRARLLWANPLLLAVLLMGSTACGGGKKPGTNAKDTIPSASQTTETPPPVKSQTANADPNADKSNMQASGQVGETVVEADAGVGTEPKAKAADDAKSPADKAPDGKTFSIASNSIINQVKSLTSNLETYMPGLVDPEIIFTSDLRSWVDNPSAWVGTYYAPLGNIVQEFKVSYSGGKLSLAVDLQVEQYSPEGFIEDVNVVRNLGGIKINQALVSWNKATNLVETQGEFVTWESGGKRYYGLLIGSGNNKNNYNLLRKAKISS
jgi:hypothetical protein